MEPFWVFELERKKGLKALSSEYHECKSWIRHIKVDVPGKKQDCPTVVFLFGMLA